MIVAVVGVGLIGGSVGLAARARLDATVRGFDPRAERRVARGAIHSAHRDLGDALDGADAVFVAVPVDVLADTVATVLAQAPRTCVVTDVGSTKRTVVDAARDPRFVGGHPLAGSEAAGVEHAREDLFDGATWYLTPTATTQGTLLERLHRLLTGLGARPAVIDADVHDRVMAAVSHLPHVVANVLVAQAIEALGGERPPATGPSFRDATRVAGANPALWGAIYAANRDALADALDDAIARLQGVSAQLRAGADLTAWQRRRRRPSPRAGGGRARPRGDPRAARRGAQPPGGHRRHRAHPRARGRQHLRHGAQPVGRQQPGRDRPVGGRRARRRGGRRWSAGLGFAVIA